MDSIIGVDIGGTSINAGLFSIEGKLIKETSVASKADLGKRHFLEKLVEAIDSLKDGSSLGIGIGCPSPIDRTNGIILNPPNIPLKDFNLKKFIENEFDMPVKVENDSNCFVLGEAVFGKAKHKNIVVGVTLGTGFGGGVVIDKNIFRGSGNAAEFWFSTIKFDGVNGKISNQGAIEEYVSLRGLLRLARGMDVNSPKDLFILAERKDKRAMKVFSEYGKLLGIFFKNIISFFDPDAIVLGGNISNAYRYFSKGIGMELKNAPFNNSEIFVSDDCNMSAMLGAAATFYPSLLRIK